MVSAAVSTVNGSSRFEETLQQVRLRKIPMAAKPREDSYTEFDQDLIRASGDLPSGFHGDPTKP